MSGSLRMRSILHINEVRWFMDIRQLICHADGPDSHWWKGGGDSIDFDALGIGSRRNTSALYTYAHHWYYAYTHIHMQNAQKSTFNLRPNISNVLWSFPVFLQVLAPFLIWLVILCTNKRDSTSARNKSRKCVKVNGYYPKSHPEINIFVFIHQITDPAQRLNSPIAIGIS